MQLSPELLLIVVIFVAAVFIIYKLFKLIVRAALAAAAGFSFPWLLNYIAGYISLPFGLPADIETGIKCAAAAVALLLLYEFAHFIAYFLKLLTWPLRALSRRVK